MWTKLITAVIIVGCYLYMCICLRETQQTLVDSHEAYKELHVKHLALGEEHLELQGKQSKLIVEASVREKKVMELAEGNIMLSRLLLGWQLNGKYADTSDAKQVEALPRGPLTIEINGKKYTMPITGKQP